jgi:hypothetical protein
MHAYFPADATLSSGQEEEEETHSSLPSYTYMYVYKINKQEVVLVSFDVSRMDDRVERETGGGGKDKKEREGQCV